MRIIVIGFIGFSSLFGVYKNYCDLSLFIGCLVYLDYIRIIVIILFFVVYLGYMRINMISFIGI